VENIFIKETTSTPEISCNIKQGLLQIKGVSLPEDTEGFYQELFDYLRANENYITEKKFTVSLMFLYLNTSSSAIVSRILQLMEQFDAEKKIITIRWYHEEDDDDMKEIGLDFKMTTDLNFEIISCEEIL